LEQRLQEASRLGFTRAIVPKGTGLGVSEAALGLQLLESSSLAEAIVGALGVNPAEE